ncbi:GlcNAc-PI de-N-acetylase [Anaerolineae bacterium CFX8]|nr:GlcNAc-PI de-N-acetylase [Anaerolineae bacterium CFX8]
MKTIMVIFAHPDDESHGPGGTLAKYAAEGIKVHYLCATRGEAGTVDNRFLQNGRSIAELRTAELGQAAAKLGLADVSFLGYRDSGMEGTPHNLHPESLYAASLDEVAGRIAEYIRRLRPDVIITHDQYGWYGHPDHIKCHCATLRAYEMLYGIRCGTADSRYVSNAPRLYVSSFSKSLLKIIVRLMPLFGRDPRRHGQNQDVDLVRIASWDIPTTARIHVRHYLPAKDRAKAAHASQQPLTQSKNGLLNIFMRWVETKETFSRLYPPVGQNEVMEYSLFGAEPLTEWELATKEMAVSG